MKKLLFICFFVSAMTGLAVAQSGTEEAPAEGPAMTFESLVVDYGEIEQHSDPLRIATFTNTGTEPLIISNARGSCGCTVPEWPKEPIMPGETSEIKVRYDTKRVGPINKTVKISTNDATGQHVLQIKGKINAAPKEEGLPKKSSVFEKPNKPNK